MNVSANALSPSRPMPLPGIAAPAAAILCGVVLGVIYSISPLSVWFVVASVGLVWLAGRGLPAREARWVRGVLIAALAVRAALIAGLFLFGTPDHMWFNVFYGDEQYLLIRSMRLRHLWLDSPLSKEAFLDVFDLYGRTTYLNVIAFVQMLFGPSPYGIHLVNIVFYASASLVLHRVVRPAFGRVAALGTLAGVLFYPSLLVWSASALKESLNFVIVVCTLASLVALVRAPWRWRPLALIVLLTCIGALRSFRAGGLEMAAAGFTTGLVIAVLARRRWLLATAAAAAAIAAVIALRTPAAQNLALRVLRPAAARHIGHVLTRGHSYKLLDQRLYVSQPTANTMTWDEATRFVERAAVSAVVFPLPWDSQSAIEVAYVPEQVAWLVILALAVAGAIAGFRSDPLVAALCLSYGACALMVVALNTGNIGTLVRHRGLALPYLIELAANGATVVIARCRS
jgi:hypothetical protein